MTVGAFKNNLTPTLHTDCDQQMETTKMYMYKRNVTLLLNKYYTTCILLFLIFKYYTQFRSIIVLFPHIAIYVQRLDSAFGVSFTDGTGKYWTNNSGPQIRVCNWKLFFLFLNQNICCGYSKEPSQWVGSFEHPKHMFKLMNKKIIAILCSRLLLNLTYEYHGIEEIVFVFIWNLTLSMRVNSSIFVWFS